MTPLPSHLPHPHPAAAEMHARLEALADETYRRNQWDDLKYDMNHLTRLMSGEVVRMVWAVGPDGTYARFDGECLSLPAGEPIEIYLVTNSGLVPATKESAIAWLDGQ